MAFELIHTFTPTAGTPVFIYVDFDQNQIDVRDENGNSLAGGPDVTELELEFTDGSNMTQRCTGFNLKQVIARIEFPYCELIIEENSASCGYTGATNCNLSFTVDIVDSTNGQNNGRITVNATGTGPFQYSLDSITWQSTNVFVNLFSGTFSVYVRDSSGCIQSNLSVIVNNEDDSTALPVEIPYKDSKNFCHFFRLIVNGTTHNISEPIKWDQVNVIGDRDEDYHGYQYKFTDGTVDLGFDCAAGLDIIEAVYNEKGSDGEVLFQYGYTYQNKDYILFPGKLLLTTRKKFSDRIECTVESEDFDATFQSRLETKVDMTATKTFDKLDVVPPAPVQIELHAKEILAKVQCTKTGGYYESASQKDRFLWIKPDNTESTFNEVKDYYEYPLSDSRIDPTTVDEFQFDFQNEVNASISLSFSLLVRLGIRNQNLFSSKNYEVVPVVVIKKINPNTGAFTNVTYEIGTKFTGSVPPLFLGDRNFNVSANWNYTGTFLKGEAIYWYVRVIFESDVKLRSFLTQNTLTLTANFLEKSVSTTSKGWFVDDALRQGINVISNNRYALRSSLYERRGAAQIKDGPGSLNIINNGFQIRNFETDLRPLQIDLKKLLSSLRAFHCIGVNYSSSNNWPVINIERADFFYQEKEIMSIAETEDYREEVAIEKLYNQIEIGYEKFQEDGYNTLDEYNTKQELLTPIKKNNKKLTLLSSLIGSGYAIEAHRREQFSKTPSNSVSNDEEPFIVAVRRDGLNYTTEKNDAFTTVTNVISPQTAYNLRLTPKRMLYNWFIWLKGAFMYKVETDSITVTNARQNNTLTTQYSSGETEIIGDKDKDIIVENESVTLSKLNSTRDIWKPEWIYIKARISPIELQILNLSLSGKYLRSKNYGYLMVKKPDGNWQAGWPYKVTYNYATERVEIKMLKKFSTPTIPEVNCCPYLVVNGCQLKINNIKTVV